MEYYTLTTRKEQATPNSTSSRNCRNSFYVKKNLSFYLPKHWFGGMNFPNIGNVICLAIILMGLLIKAEI